LQRVAEAQARRQAQQQQAQQDAEARAQAAKQQAQQDEARAEAQHEAQRAAEQKAEQQRVEQQKATQKQAEQKKAAQAEVTKKEEARHDEQVKTERKSAEQRHEAYEKSIAEDPQVAAEAKRTGKTVDEVKLDLLAKKLGMGPLAEAFEKMPEGERAAIEDLWGHLSGPERAELTLTLGKMPPAQQLQALNTLIRVHHEIPPPSNEGGKLVEAILGTAVETNPALPDEHCQTQIKLVASCADPSRPAMFNPATGAVEVSPALLNESPDRQRADVLAALYQADDSFKMQGSGDPRRDITVQFKDSVMRAAADSGMTYTANGDGTFKSEVSNRMQYQSSVLMLATQYGLPEKYTQQPAEFRRLLAQSPEARAKADPQAAAAVERAIADVKDPLAFVAHARVLGSGALADTHPQLAEHLARIDATGRAQAGDKITAGFRTDGELALHYDEQALQLKFAEKEPLAYAMSERGGRLSPQEQKAFIAYQQERMALIKDYAEGRYDASARVAYWQEPGRIEALQTGLAGHAAQIEQRAAVGTLRTQTNEPILLLDPIEPGGDMEGPTAAQPMSIPDIDKLQNAILKARSPEKIGSVMTQLGTLSETPQGRERILETLRQQSSTPQGAIQLSQFMRSAADAEPGQLSRVLGAVAETPQGAAGLGEVFQNLASTSVSARVATSSLAAMSSTPEGAAAVGRMLNTMAASGSADDAGAFLQMLGKAGESADGGKQVASLVDHMLSEPSSAGAFKDVTMKALDSPQGGQRLADMLGGLTRGEGESYTGVKLVNFLVADSGQRGVVLDALRSTPRGTMALTEMIVQAQTPAAMSLQSKLDSVPMGRTSGEQPAALEPASASGANASAMSQEERLQDAIRRAQSPERVGSAIRQMAALSTSPQGAGRVAEAMLRHSATPEGAAEVTQFLGSASESDAGSAAVRKLLTNIASSPQGAVTLPQIFEKLSENPANARSLAGTLAGVTRTPEGAAEMGRVLANMGDGTAFLEVLNHATESAPGRAASSELLDHLLNQPSSAEVVKDMTLKAAGTPQGAQNLADMLSHMTSPGEVAPGMPRGNSATMAANLVLFCATGPQNQITMLNGLSSSPKGAAALAAIAANADPSVGGFLLHRLDALAESPEGAAAVGHFVETAAASPEGRSGLLAAFSSNAQTAASFTSFLAAMPPSELGATLDNFSSGKLECNGLVSMLGAASTTPEGGAALSKLVAGAAQSPETAGKMALLLARADGGERGELMTSMLSNEGGPQALSSLLAQSSSGGDGVTPAMRLMSDLGSTPARMEALTSTPQSAASTAQALSNLASSSQASQVAAMVHDMTRSAEGSRVLLGGLRQMAAAPGGAAPTMQMLTQLTLRPEGTGAVADMLRGAGKTRTGIDTMMAVLSEGAKSSPTEAKQLYQALQSQPKTADAAAYFFKRVSLVPQNAKQLESVQASLSQPVAAPQLRSVAEPSQAPALDLEAPKVEASTSTESQPMHEAQRNYSIMGATPHVAREAARAIVGTVSSASSPLVGAALQTTQNIKIGTLGPSAANLILASQGASERSHAASNAPGVSRAVSLQAAPEIGYEGSKAPQANVPVQPEKLVSPLATRNTQEVLHSIMGSTPERPSVAATSVSVAAVNSPPHAVAMAALEKAAQLEQAEEAAATETEYHHMPSQDVYAEFREFMRGADGKPIKGKHGEHDAINAVGGVYKREVATDQEREEHTQSRAGLAGVRGAERAGRGELAFQRDQIFTDDGGGGRGRYSSCPDCGHVMTSDVDNCPRCISIEDREVAMVSQVRFASGGYYLDQSYADNIEITATTRHIFQAGETESIAVLRRPPVYPTYSELLSLSKAG
jgi:hypothetical protein